MVRPGGVLHRGARRPHGWVPLDQGAQLRPGAGEGVRGDGSPREDESQPSPGRDGLGEVYVVGVDPAEQGSGLGRALTLAGLHYLQDLGIAQAMLYVDEDNVPAIRIYEGVGFTRARVDAMYRRPPGASPRGTGQ